MLPLKEILLPRHEVLLDVFFLRDLVAGLSPNRISKDIKTLLGREFAHDHGGDTNRGPMVGGAVGQQAHGCLDRYFPAANRHHPCLSYPSLAFGYRDRKHPVFGANTLPSPATGAGPGPEGVAEAGRPFFPLPVISITRT